MNKTLIAAAALAAVSLVHAATGPAGLAADAVDPPSPALSILYQDTGTDSGTGVLSQNFEASFSAYDAAAADDFTVPAGATWAIREVDVTGLYYNGTGPADSESVTIYKATAQGKVGKVVASYPEQHGSDNDGAFRISIPSTRLGPGTYYVSVVINMSFTVGGEWHWENMLEVHGYPPEWENPDGSGPCRTWKRERKCFGPGTGDHFFVLLGNVQ
jgi:hypothetical protein